MSAVHERLRLTRMWVERAEEDLFAAKQLLLSPKNFCPYPTICFHAQQSVEKYAKALLVFLSIPFPRVHDIGELLNLVPTSIRLPLTTEQQEQFTFYATAARYPGEYEPVSREDAEQMVSAATTLRDTIRDQLPKEVLGAP